MTLLFLLIIPSVHCTRVHVYITLQYIDMDFVHFYYNIVIPTLLHSLQFNRPIIAHPNIYPIMHSERIFSLNVWYLYGTTYPMMLSLHWTLQFFVPDLDLLTYHPFVRYIPFMFRQFVSARTHCATTCLLAYVCVFICMQSINQSNQNNYMYPHCYVFSESLDMTLLM